ncbi:uncharacterized protein LOC126735137 [Anthonomus grandis grandis]|uniref:uncharacterized protein LOC126735137 n=1 Tax=Anthonomus grandis grandis TaxID=2921223 RepID=UPI0021657F50|nr:uncharacterized protein LOC126735137 [Anthonomus grandis grandis]
MLYEVRFANYGSETIYAVFLLTLAERRIKDERTKLEQKKQELDEQEKRLLELKKEIEGCSISGNPNTHPSTSASTQSAQVQNQNAIIVTTGVRQNETEIQNHDEGEGASREVVLAVTSPVPSTSISADNQVTTQPEIKKYFPIFLQQRKEDAKKEQKNKTLDFWTDKDISNLISNVVYAKQHNNCYYIKYAWQKMGMTRSIKAYRNKVESLMKQCNQNKMAFITSYNITAKDADIFIRT